MIRRLRMLQAWEYYRKPTARSSDYQQTTSEGVYSDVRKLSMISISSMTARKGVAIQSISSLGSDIPDPQLWLRCPRTYVRYTLHSDPAHLVPWPGSSDRARGSLSIESRHAAFLAGFSTELLGCIADYASFRMCANLRTITALQNDVPLIFAKIAEKRWLLAKA